MTSTSEFFQEIATNLKHEIENVDILDDRLICHRKNSNEKIAIIIRLVSDTNFYAPFKNAPDAVPFPTYKNKITYNALEVSIITSTLQHTTLFDLATILGERDISYDRIDGTFGILTKNKELTHAGCLIHTHYKKITDGIFKYINHFDSM